MSTQRVSRRIDGKVVKGYLVDGVFYRTKAEAGLSRKQRIDKKAVSQNNIVPVVYRLLMQDGLRLLDAVKDDAEAEQLVLDTAEHILDVVFLLQRCAPSYDYWMEKQSTARRCAYAFLCRFYPEELENAENKDAVQFRVTVPPQQSIYMDSADDTWLRDWREAHAGS